MHGGQTGLFPSLKTHGFILAIRPACAYQCGTLLDRIRCRILADCLDVTSGDKEQGRNLGQNMEDHVVLKTGVHMVGDGVG